MTNSDLLNQPTDELMSKEATKKTAIVAYFVFSLFAIVILSIFICVKTKECEALKSKAHNDSIAVQSLKDNLLIPTKDSLISK